MDCPSCGFENISGADHCAECETDLTDLDVRVGKTAFERSVMKDPVVRLIPNDPLKVTPSASIREVIQRLIDSGRNCALVVDEDGKMSCIFTERDVLLRVAHRFDEVADQPVAEFMTPDPERLRPVDTVAFGLNRMMVGDYRHLPVEKDGKALGVVSVRHILGYIAERNPAILSPTR